MISTRIGGEKVMRRRRMTSNFAAALLLSACGSVGLPSTPLFVGIESAGYRPGEKMLQDRLTARFPIGSSDQNIAEYLEQQGLKVDYREKRYRGAQASGVATFTTESFVCGSEVQIAWLADPEHKLRRIEVFYGDTGCP